MDQDYRSVSHKEKPRNGTEEKTVQCDRTGRETHSPILCRGGEKLGGDGGERAELVGEAAVGCEPDDTGMHLTLIPSFASLPTPLLSLDMHSSRSKETQCGEGG